MNCGSGISGFPAPSFCFRRFLPGGTSRFFFPSKSKQFVFPVLVNISIFCSAEINNTVKMILLENINVKKIRLPGRNQACAKFRFHFPPKPKPGFRSGNIWPESRVPDLKNPHKPGRSASLLRPPSLQLIMQ